MWAQAMMEYGVMDAVAGGVARVGSFAQSAFADPAGRTIIIIVGAVLGYWLLRRN